MSKSIQTAAAKHIEKLTEYSENIVCVITGTQASHPVMLYGHNGWTSTPYQNAGYAPEKIINWLQQQHGPYCLGYLAEINSDGSATIYNVTVDDAEEDAEEDDREPESAEVSEHETLPAFCWLDQDMVLAVQSRGDRFSGGSDVSTAEVVQSWLDADFDADSAGEWMDVGCFDADSARELVDAGFTPEQIEGADYDGKESLGYDYANGNVSLDAVRELVDAE